MTQRVRHIICILMLTSFVSYWSGITLFGHIHEVDGASIVHSHPGAKGHDHSSPSLLTISAISDLSFDTNFINSSEINRHINTCTEINTLYLYRLYTENHRGFVSLRAPPAA